MSELLQENFDPEFVASELRRVGAVSVSLVPDGLRNRLLSAFESLDFKPTRKDYITSHSITLDQGDDIFCLVGAELNRLVEQLKAYDQLLTPFRNMVAMKYRLGAYLEPHVDEGEFEGIACSLLLEGKPNFSTYPHAAVGGSIRYPEFYPNTATPFGKHEVAAKVGDGIFFRQRSFGGLLAIPHEIYQVTKTRKVAIYNSYAA